MNKINDLKYNICRACLSSDRKLSEIDEFIDVFNIISSVSYSDMLPVYVCWECMAMLKKIKVFKSKVEEAQEILAKHLVTKKKSPFKSLSNLTTTYTDSTIIITHDENIETKQKLEIKQEIDDDHNYLSDASENFCQEEIKKENAINNLCKEKDTSPIDNKRKKEKKRAKNYEIVHGTQRYKYLRKEFAIDAVDIKNWLKKETESDFYKNFKFKCELCIHGFNCEKKLKEHVLKNHDESLGPHICFTCNSRHTTEAALSSHMRRHMRAWECTRCGFQCYTRRRLHAHMNGHAVVLCGNCGASFPDIPTFFYHNKALHTIYICDQCGKRCKSKRMIERHVSRHLETHICPTCHRRYKTRSTLQRHYSIKHTSSVEPAYCVVCDKRYSSAILYRRHLNHSAAHAHERDKQFKKFLCPECGNSYSRRAYMMNHYQHVHTNQSKYHCSQCDKHFLNRTRYVDHMRYLHEGIQREKNKLCNVCGKGFAANRTLLNHIRTHSGERPYECEHCSAKFTQRTSMLTHVKYVHLKSKRKVQWQ